MSDLAALPVKQTAPEHLDRSKGEHGCRTVKVSNLTTSEYTSVYANGEVRAEKLV